MSQPSDIVVGCRLPIPWLPPNPGEAAGGVANWEPTRSLRNGGDGARNDSGGASPPAMSTTEPTPAIVVVGEGVDEDTTNDPGVPSQT